MMPTIPSNGISIYYEIHGAGEPVLLIGGLANDVTDFERTVHPRFPGGAFPGHRLRQSWGGAQRQAARTLFHGHDGGRRGRTAGPGSALCARTSSASPWADGSPLSWCCAIRRGATSWFWSQPDQDRFARGECEFCYSFPGMPFFRGKYPQPPYAFKNQLAASSNYDCSARLKQVEAPTLVMHGRKDGVAPFAIAEDMTQAIPNSRMVAENGGHMFFFFRPKDFVAEVTAFLAAGDASVSADYAIDAAQGEPDFGCCEPR